jgi:hypothetical protein
MHLSIPGFFILGLTSGMGRHTAGEIAYNSGRHTSFDAASCQSPPIPCLASDVADQHARGFFFATVFRRVTQKATFCTCRLQKKAQRHCEGFEYRCKPLILVYVIGEQPKRPGVPMAEKWYWVDLTFAGSIITHRAPQVAVQPSSHDLSHGELKFRLG